MPHLFFLAFINVDDATLSKVFLKGGYVADQVLDRDGKGWLVNGVGLMQSLSYAFCWHDGCT